MLKWLRYHATRLLGLTDAIAQAAKLANEAEALNKQAQARLDEAVNVLNAARGVQAEIRKVTTIDVDLAFRPGQPNTIILCGHYRNRAYVNVFEIRTDDFGDLISHLKNLEKWGEVRHLDGPPMFQAVFDRERL